MKVGTVGQVEKFVRSAVTGWTKIGKVGDVVKNIVTARINVGTVGGGGRSREEHREGFTEFKHRDGLSNVEKNDLCRPTDKRRRHVRTIDRLEEIEATIYSGTA